MKNKEEFVRRAQVELKKRFIEDLYNLKSSIADLLRGESKYIVADIDKLQDDFQKLTIQDKAFAKLNTAGYLEEMKSLLETKFDSDIEKYKRFNNYYNNYIVDPIKKNLGLFGIQLNPADLENKDLGKDIVQPSTLKLTKNLPDYLRLKEIPEIDDEGRTKSWHSKLNDMNEMLKVLGEYVPIFELMINDMDLIDTDTTQIISLEDNTQINANIAEATKFYALAGQIASRMKTAKLVVAKAGNALYGLEQMPKEFVLAPTQNREVVDILWKNYLASGTDRDILSRVKQIRDDEAEIKKKFRRVYEQWVVLYQDTAKKIGVPVTPQIKLQLVRYGQESIINEYENLIAEFENWVEDVRDFASQATTIETMLQPQYTSKVAQLRAPEGPQAPQGPQEPGRMELPPAPEFQEGEVEAKPPKLPLGEEWLELVFAEDKDLYYSKNNSLTPPQAISMAGRNNLLISMQYQKAEGTGDPEENVVKNYVLEPYSYRMKRTKVRNGVRKYFFGYDSMDASIKAFLVGNIKAVQILPEKYSPRWEVEFH